MAATNVSLKLFIDKKNRRVLFAEADKEFIDFLFSIFTLPVGTVTRVLKEGGGNGMVGCLSSLYNSIKNLSVTYIQPDKKKLFLLEPKVVMPGSKLPPLLLPNVGLPVRQLYRCSNNSRFECNSYVADDNSTLCPYCKSKMGRIVTFVDPPSAIRPSSSEEGYVKGTVIYMVMDDLEVKALSTSSLVTLFNKFNVNVNETEAIEEKVVDLGMDEGVKLLKASLQSETVLTDVFLPAELIKTEESIKNEGKEKQLSSSDTVKSGSSLILEGEALPPL